MESRKKILVVIPYFPPNAGGGAEKYAYNINRRLAREHGCDIVVVTSTNKKIIAPAMRTNGIKIYRLPYRFKISNSPVSIAWFWKLRKIICTENPDIINIHAPVPGIGDIAAAVCGKRPLVVNYHMGTMKKHKSLLNIIIWAYENIVLKRMLKKARRIISSSDFVRDEFLISYRYKTTTITPAVDSEFFHPAKSPSQNKNILFVGALSRGDEHKGLGILLRSCQKLIHDFPDLHLTVVGGGDGVDYFRKMADGLKLQDVVTFTGRLEGRPWAESYRNATIYAHPSSNDSFPLVIAEAMASRLPVVSTIVGGIPTLVDDGVTGLLVPPRNEPAFTDALRKLLSDPELAWRLGAAGRQKAVSKLNWSKQADSTYRLFMESTGPIKSRTQTKIAVVSPYYHPVYGHISDYIKQSAEYFKKLPAHDVFVITRNRWSRQYRVKVDNGITVYKLPAFFWFPFGLISPFRSRKIRKIFEQELPDIVQLHIPAPNMASAALSAARDLPVILTYHSRGMIRKKFLSGGAIKLYDKLFRERLFKDAVAVIVPSPVMLHESLQKFRYKTHVIIPRIKPSLFTMGLKRKRRLRRRSGAEDQKTYSAVASENELSSIAISGLSNSGKKHIWKAHMLQNLQLIESVINHKPNIVQLSAYFPPHLGGVEVVTQEISQELASRGNRVRVLTSNIGAKRTADDAQIQDTNLIVDTLGSFEFAHTPFMPKLFWKLCQVKKPTIFHLHLSQIFLPEIMWTVAKLRKIPYVVHFHLDVDPSGPLGFLFVLYKKLFWPILMHGAAHVIALSPEQAKMVRERYGLDDNNVSYIPNGVSNKFLQIGEKSRTFHKPLRLFYLGRLDKQKHFDRMIEALAFVKSNVRLDIVGDGEERAKLENLAAQLKLTNVTFHGPKTGDDRLQYYKNADVFVLPSDKEGMPLVMFEAMASGLPVIGSDVQGIREHLKNVGILVSNPSPATFAKAIDEFYDDREKLYPLLSKSSKEKAAQYSWPLLTNRIEALYRKIPLEPAKKDKVGVGVFAAVAIWWLAFLGLRAMPSIPDIVVNAVGFSFLAVVPGLLTVMSMPLKPLSAVAKMSLSVGFSILEMILIGLLGNTVLQWFGIARPLDAPYLIVEISLLLVILCTLVRIHGQRSDMKIFQRLRKLLPTGKDRFTALFPLIFVLMSILGAITLNNGGTDAITLTMLIGMALFCSFLAFKSRKLSDSAIASAIFSMALALLFMTSLRGWFTTGHDIQVEYQMFEMTRSNGAWQIQLLRVPYNACLSITILPAMFVNLLKTLDPYIFKIYFQILFAVCPVIVYLIARKWLSKGLAFIATLYFISFPTFFTDMPFLNRQEIAFVFFALMIYILFQDTVSIAVRRSIFLLLGTGLVVSHYSTTYAVILTLAMAIFVLFPIRKIGNFLSRFRIFAHTSMLALRPAREQKRFTVSMIIALALGSFIWTSVLTQTGNNTLLVVRETFQALQAGLSGQKLKSNDTNYSLSSFAATSPELELKDYVDKQINPQRARFAKNYYPANTYDSYDIKAIHDPTMPLTRIGKFIAAKGIDVESLNTGMRQGSAKLLQVFVLLGFLFVLFRRKHVQMMCSDFIALSYGSAIFVALQVFLPVLSVEYGLLRAFQQSLIVLGIFTVLGSVALFSWLPTRPLKIGVPVLFAILFFLSNTGVITQMFGGYLAQLNLNNSGTYYNIYYTHGQEIAGIQWLNSEDGTWRNGVYRQNEPAQFDDQYTYGKLVTYTNLVNESDIYPGIVIKNAYIFLGYDNVRDKQATVSYNGDLVTYRYPVQFLDNHKDLIYANGGAAVYR